MGTAKPVFILYRLEAGSYKGLREGHMTEGVIEIKDEDEKRRAAEVVGR